MMRYDEVGDPVHDASYCANVRCWLCLDGGMYWTGERGVYCRCEAGQESKINCALIANGKMTEVEQRIRRSIHLEGVVAP